MKNRTIKVEEFFLMRRYRESVASQIRLKGLWLKQAGFQPGDRVEVVSRKGELVIRRMA